MSEESDHEHDERPPDDSKKAAQPPTKFEHWYERIGTNAKHTLYIGGAIAGFIKIVQHFIFPNAEFIMPTLAILMAVAALVDHFWHRKLLTLSPAAPLFAMVAFFSFLGLCGLHLEDLKAAIPVRDFLWMRPITFMWFVSIILNLYVAQFAFFARITAIEKSVAKLTDESHKRTEDLLRVVSGLVKRTNELKQNEQAMISDVLDIYERLQSTLPRSTTTTTTPDPHKAAQLGHNDIEERKTKLRHRLDFDI